MGLRSGGVVGKSGGEYFSCGYDIFKGFVVDGVWYVWEIERRLVFVEYIEVRGDNGFKEVGGSIMYVL